MEGMWGKAGQSVYTAYSITRNARESGASQNQSSWTTPWCNSSSWLSTQLHPESHKAHSEATPVRGLSHFRLFETARPTLNLGVTFR